MESVEVSAKTVDEAIDIALEDLGLKRSEVDIEVLTPGKPGLFGLGGEQARVRGPALVENVRRTGAPLPPAPAARAGGGAVLSFLVGRRGTTLAALQYFVNVLVTRKLGSR